MGETTRLVTEAEWQQQVLDVAAIYGWQHLHVRKAIGRRGGARGWQTTTNIDGWPDLLLWNPRHDVGYLVALELKSDSGRPTDAQLAVLAQLSATGLIRTMVARPDDFDAVHDLLRVNPNRA